MSRSYWAVIVGTGLAGVGWCVRSLCRGDAMRIRSDREKIKEVSWNTPHFRALNLETATAEEVTAAYAASFPHNKDPWYWAEDYCCVCRNGFRDKTIRLHDSTCPYEDQDIDICFQCLGEATRLIVPSL